MVVDVLELSMYAAREGTAGDWPEVAAVLHDEIERLRVRVRVLESERYCAVVEAQEREHGRWAL